MHFLRLSFHISQVGVRCVCDGRAKEARPDAGPDHDRHEAKRAATAPVTLTAKRIADAPARARRYWLADVQVPGLLLFVEPGGGRAFYVRTSIGRGREGRTQVTVRIGDAATTPLAEARSRALTILAEARSGVDPRASKTRAPTLTTVSAALDRHEATLATRGSCAAWT